MIPGYRLMWLIVVFDLPVETKANKRDYRRFVDFLEDHGYSRIQYSIYVCPTTTHDHTEVHAQRIADNLPPEGDVRVFRLTDKQWARTDCYYNGRSGIAEPPPEQFLFFDEDYEPAVPDWTPPDKPVPSPEDSQSEATVLSPPTVPTGQWERPNPGVGKRKSRKKALKPKQDALDL
jgi:CRISPR-associated protein Cas2